MSAIPDAYVQQLDPIYRYILQSFPRLEPSRKKGYGLAIQTLYAHQQDQPKFELGQIYEACRKMAEKGVVEIRNEIFVHPTDLGEQLIAKLAKQPLAAEQVPDFPAVPM